MSTLVGMEVEYKTWRANPASGRSNIDYHGETGVIVAFFGGTTGDAASGFEVSACVLLVQPDGSTTTAEAGAFRFLRPSEVLRRLCGEGGER